MDNSLMASNAFVAVMVAILAFGLWSAWKLRRHREDEGDGGDPFDVLARAYGEGRIDHDELDRRCQELERRGVRARSRADDRTAR